MRAKLWWSTELERQTEPSSAPARAKQASDNCSCPRVRGTSNGNRTPTGSVSQQELQLFPNPTSKSTGCLGQTMDTHTRCHQQHLAAGAEHEEVRDGTRRGFQRDVDSASWTSSESHQCRGGTRTALHGLVQDFPTPLCS